LPREPRGDITAILIQHKAADSEAVANDARRSWVARHARDPLIPNIVLVRREPNLRVDVHRSHGWTPAIDRRERAVLSFASRTCGEQQQLRHVLKVLGTLALVSTPTQPAREMMHLHRGYRRGGGQGLSALPGRRQVRQVEDSKRLSFED